MSVAIGYYAFAWKVSDMHKNNCGAIKSMGGYKDED
jgi:hypothetical protein